MNGPSNKKLKIEKKNEEVLFKGDSFSFYKSRKKGLIIFVVVLLISFILTSVNTLKHTETA
jgi:hypothetical protein